MRKDNALRWLWLAVVVLILDQLTKYLAVGYLAVYQTAYVLPFFNLTLAFNTGAAFSFLSGNGGTSNYIFMAFASVVSVALIAMLGKLASSKKLQAMSLALILGGALGNLFDRIRLGFVVDFLDFHVGGYHWPAFNLADSAICVGVVLLIIDIYRSR